MNNRKKVIAISIIILLFLGVYLYLKNPSFYYYSLSECGTGTSAPVPTRISFFNIGLVVGEEQITFLPYKEYKVVLSKYKELKKKLNNYNEDYEKNKCLQGGYYIISGKKYSSRILEDPEIKELVIYIEVLSNKKSY